MPINLDETGVGVKKDGEAVGEGGCGEQWHIDPLFQQPSLFLLGLVPAI